jgi:hypothetical protein
VSNITALALVVTGIPTRGKLFAAEGVRALPGVGRDRFQRTWVSAYPCPQNLGRAASRGHEPKVATDEELARSLLDWIGDSCCWAVDGEHVRKWLRFWTARFKRPCPVVLDPLILACILDPCRGFRSGAQVAEEHLRPLAGRLVRAQDTLECLDRLSRRFQERAEACPEWAAVLSGWLRACTGSSETDRLAQQIVRILLDPDAALRQDLFSLKIPQELQPLEESQALRTSLQDFALFHSAYRIEPVPPGKPTGRGAVQPGTAEKIVTEIFSVHVPQHFGSLDGKTGSAPKSLRPTQGTMALEVLRNMQGQARLAINAETGTGKTLAYLVPAAVTALSTGRRVIVSTFTRALQDQIASRDSKLTAELLRAVAPGSRPLSVRIIKGASNYLCCVAMLNRLAEPAASAAERLARCLVLNAAVFGPHGFAPEPQGLPKNIEKAVQDLLRDVRSTGRCQHPRRGIVCPHASAQRALPQADIVVANHSWLLHQALSDGPHLVVDEADLLTQAADGCSRGR